jgi:hypothetical protein
MCKDYETHGSQWEEPISETDVSCTKLCCATFSTSAKIGCKQN